jgi:hypothetical protein
MRAIVKQTYKVILRSQSGLERTWNITDCYIERRLKKIKREMLEQIRDNDQESAFSLGDDIDAEEAMESEHFEKKPTVNPHGAHCPWHGVDLDNDYALDMMDDTPCSCSARLEDYQLGVIMNKAEAMDIILEAASIRLDQWVSAIGNVGPALNILDEIWEADQQERQEIADRLAAALDMVREDTS